MDRGIIKDQVLRELKIGMVVSLVLSLILQDKREI